MPLHRFEPFGSAGGVVDRPEAEAAGQAGLKPASLTQCGDDVGVGGRHRLLGPLQDERQGAGE